MISVDTKIEDKSQDLIKRTSEAGIKAYKKCGTKMVKVVRDDIAYRTGLLKDSIGKKVEIMDGLPLLDVGAKRKVRGTRAYHAHLVEKGTVRRTRKNGKTTGTMPAKPFLENKREELQKILEQSLKEELKKIEG